MIYNLNGEHEKNITMPYYEKGDYESIYSKKLTAMDKNSSRYTIKGLNSRLIKTTEGKEF